MPFISIIIPTHNNEEHIEQAILSCFDSDFDDFEIIVINDASTDETENTIEKLLKYKPEVIRLITNKKNLGAGLSRNIGIDKASGEYLLFLDGDDWFEPNAVKTAAISAKKTKADVTIFNHQRAWPDNTKTVNLPNKYTKLGLAEKNLSEIKNRQDAMKNLHTVWNKMYCKKHLKKIKIRFTSGLYQDVLWSVKSLCLAKVAYYNPAILINYRQRQGAVTKTKSNAHFDIFRQLDTVLCFIESNPHIEEHYAKHIFLYCKSLLFGIIKTNYRIKKSDEKKFILNCHKEIKKWRVTLKIKTFDLPWITLRTGNRKIFMLTQRKINHKFKFNTSN